MAEVLEDLEEKWIMYKDRNDWADLKPVKQNDGPHPVVKIAYSEDFSDVYDYFRGVVAVGELSERALTLTEDAIQMNAANYTVWQYRRKILEHLKWDLQDELLFCREMIEANPKNYQVWHHRRVIVEWLGDGSKELQLTKIIFAQDAKNYHAWEHRQWALRTFGLYEGELEFTAELLEDDVRNNSAWNHRYFVQTRTTGLNPQVLRSELAFTQRAIERLTDNESPWTYMKGLLNDTSGDEDAIEACWRDAQAWCWKLLGDKIAALLPALSNSNASADAQLNDEEPLSLVAKLPSIPKGSISPHLLIGALDFVTHQLEKTEDPRLKETPLKVALKLCDTLAAEHDSIRVRYWNYVRRRLLHQHRSDAATA